MIYSSEILYCNLEEIVSVYEDSKVIYMQTICGMNVVS